MHIWYGYGVSALLDFLNLGSVYYHSIGLSALMQQFGIFQPKTLKQDSFHIFKQGT